MFIFGEASKIGGRVAALFALWLFSHWLWDKSQEWYDSRFFCYLFLAVAALIAFNLIGEINKGVLNYWYQLALKHEINKPHPDWQEGDGFFISEIQAENLDWFNPHTGQFAGVMNGRPTFIPWKHCLILAPSGGQKTIAQVLPNLSHGYRIIDEATGKSRTASAIVTDLKRELKPMTAALRRKQHGQRVITLDYADPNTAIYNALDIIHDSIRTGNFATANTRAKIISNILKPEPNDGVKEKFWHDGPLHFIEFGILYCCQLKPDEATLLDVSALMYSNDALQLAVEMSLNSTTFLGRLKELANTIHGMEKYFTQHLLSGRLDMSHFSPSSPVAPCMGKSTFRWHEFKANPTTLFMGANLSEQKAVKDWVALMIECMCIEFLEYEGGNIPVELVLEEFTNFKVDIGSKLTALRYKGFRCKFIVQQWSDVVKVYGKDVANTIWGECDLKIIYGGFDDDNLVKKILSILGEKTVFKSNYNIGKTPFDEVNQSAGVEKKPLLSARQTMAMKEILVLTSHHHALLEKLAVNKVAPWCDWVEKNPFEATPLPREPQITLSYSRRRNFWQNITVKDFKRTGRVVFNKANPSPVLRWLWLCFAAVYCCLVLMVVNMNELFDTTPHLLIGTHQTYSGYYARCNYVSIGSFVMHSGRDCPFIKMIDTSGWTYINP